MRTASPAFTLASLLAAAALVLGGGWWLSLRSVEKRIPPDRAALRELATELQRELLRLEALFQLDFRELADKTANADEAKARELCDGLYGVVQFSRLKGNEALPVPTRAGGSSASEIILPPEDASPAGDASGFGWFVPDDTRFWVVWKRIGTGNTVAFLLDRDTIIDRVDFALRHLIEKRVSGRMAGNLYTVEAPSGGRLTGLAEPPAGRDPDMMLPLVCRFGDWQIVAWDQTTLRNFHDPATLALAFTIGGVLAILGFILFIQQRRAARLAEQRVSFVNRVSHELGAPLTNILLNLDLIEDEDVALPEATRRRLRLVREEAQRLGRLVNNVLTFSKHERNRFQLSPAANVPDEIVASVLQQFQPALERRGIRTQWSGEAGQCVSIDGDAFAQIISNLVSNAEKYAAEGKRLDIETRMEQGELAVRVSDGGPGIPPAHAARIFEPFERVDSRVNEGSSGAGLGLSIARDLAHLMGGRLRLLDGERGAAFELRVPVEKEEP
jgi:signal transduction histidine kinase